jgi:hypothetical protein
MIPMNIITRDSKTQNQRGYESKQDYGPTGIEGNGIISYSRMAARLGASKVSLSFEFG